MPFGWLHTFRLGVCLRPVFAVRPGDWLCASIFTVTNGCNAYNALIAPLAVLTTCGKSF